ncbi:MAG TPA: hypothetical protein V6C65_10110, partial [Allocoleopsis sp.]
MILFAGAAPYEFVNVSALVTTGATFDEDYVEGAISKTAINDLAAARFFKPVVEQEVWLHANLFLGATLPLSAQNNPIIMFKTSEQVEVGGLGAASGTLYLRSGNTSIDITGLVTRNVLNDVDIHLFQFGSIRVVELYIAGNFVAEARSTAVWLAPTQVILGGCITSANYFSELAVIEGNEPTIGMRIHSKRPDPSLPGLNTFDSGFWGALANGTLTDGVVTSDPGARLTGGFQPYTGPAEPLGIRGVVQSARYLKNGSLLELKGQLRIADVNYD